MAQEQHILINGGGLAGLALAIALAKQNIRSTVFELRATPSTIGGSISLAPNALRVLENNVGILDDIRPEGYEYEHIQLMSDDGWQLGLVTNGSRKDYGYSALRVFRSTLHNKFVECAQREKNLIDIRWDTSIKAIQEDENSVRATLQDGSTIEGTIVVGADGMHSTVREHILGGKAPQPVYSGIFGVAGLVNRADIDLRNCTPPTMVQTQHGTLLLMPFTPTGDRMTWSMQQSVPEKTREGWHDFIVSGQALAECRKQFPDPPQPIKDVLEKTRHDTIRGWAPYSLPELPTWHTRRVVLIGDAAHAIPPFAGQGAAQAFEDVGFLTRLLSEPEALKNGYEALFAHFESIRKERFAYVRKVTQISGRSRGNMGYFRFTLTKYLMWAILLFKSSLLGTDEVYTWDVDKQPLVPTET